ncbi:MAG: hypothetical protein NTU81_01435 [Candidatus Nomurabacteria bacterium]|nr:hypothetical protein [Candidatus Nomurabacteria bacterium]
METEKLMPKNILIEFIFGEEIIRILEKRMPIRELKTESPLFMDYYKMMQPSLIEPLAKQIAMKILAEGKGIEIIAGSTSPILAFEVASILRLPFLWVVNEKMPEEVKGRKVAFVTDNICTGKHTFEALHYIKHNYAKCEDVYCVFDYNFNLNKGLKDINIFSLLEIEDIKDLEQISKWKENSRYLFGKENRKEISPAIAG